MGRRVNERHDHDRTALPASHFLFFSHHLVRAGIASLGALYFSCGPHGGCWMTYIRQGRPTRVGVIGRYQTSRRRDAVRSLRGTTDSARMIIARRWRGALSAPCCPEHEARARLIRPFYSVAPSTHAHPRTCSTEWFWKSRPGPLCTWEAPLTLRDRTNKVGAQVSSPISNFAPAVVAASSCSLPPSAPAPLPPRRRSR